MALARVAKALNATSLAETSWKVRSGSKTRATRIFITESAIVSLSKGEVGLAMCELMALPFLDPERSTLLRDSRSQTTRAGIWTQLALHCDSTTALVQDW